MKQMAKLAALGIVAVAASATLPVDAATLTWTGAANNNLWCDADNWDAGAINCGPPVWGAAILAAHWENGHLARSLGQRASRPLPPSCSY